MDRVFSFPPVCAADARVLILGSMPGAASLAAGEYYAHPQNGFWPIMGALIGAGREVAYTDRLDLLKKQGIALWDVLQTCERAGSLDSAISAEAPNDFVGFFRGCPNVRAVFFNGQKAASSFRRFVLPGLPGFSLPMTVLPSTSPAHAGMRFEEKLARWRVVQDQAREVCSPNSA